MDTLSEHPMAAIFPEMPKDDFQSLVADIREHGVREPIWIYEGKILDGRNRYRACREAGKKCPTRKFKGSRHEALAMVWSMNRERRHLNSSQAAVAEVKRAELVAEYGAEVEKIKAEAKQKQKAAGSRGKEGGRGHKKTLGKHVSQGFSDEAHEKRTATQRAKAAGTNRLYLTAAEKLIKEDPETADQVLRGEKSMRRVIQDTAQKKQPHKPAKPTNEHPGLYMPDGRPPRLQGQVFAEEGKLVDAAIDHIKAACKAIEKCNVKYGFGDKSREDLNMVFSELRRIMKGVK